MSVMPQGKHTHNSFMHYTNFKFKPKLNLTNPFPRLYHHITVVLQLATIKLFMFWSTRSLPLTSLRHLVSQSEQNGQCRSSRRSSYGVIIVACATYKYRTIQCYLLQNVNQNFLKEERAGSKLWAGGGREVRLEQ